MELTSLMNGTLDASSAGGVSNKSDAKDINDRFLKLLVAQMKNQDPLNPMDNAQVTTQMAQISTVTGIDKLSDTVARLLDQFTGLQTLQAAQLNGHDVLVAGNRLQLAAGSTAMGAVDLPGDATSLNVEIRDANGLLVRTLDLGARTGGITRFNWDGLTDGGVATAPGNYTFTALAKAGSSEFAPTTLMAGRVEGVRNEGGTVQLMLSGIGAVAYSDVKQIL